MKYLVISALLLAWTVSAAAVSGTEPRYLFRSIDSDSGLPDNNVRDMIMLPDGMMCIQNAEMLNLFDGTSSRSFRFDPGSVPFQEYSGLGHLFYSDDALWYSRQELTWKFDMSTHLFEYDNEKIIHPYDIGGEHLESLTISSDGSYWIVSAEGGLWQCDASTGKARRTELPESLVSPVIMDVSNSYVRILSLDGAFAVYDSLLHSFTECIPNIASSRMSSSRMDMAAGSDGDLWIMFDTELIRHREDGRIERIRNVPLEPNDIFTTIAYDGKGSLWIGSAKSGVSILNTRTLAVENLAEIELADGRRVGHDTDISKIYIDPQDGVWVATNTEGVYYWHRDIFRIHSVNHETLGDEVLRDENVMCIAEEADGRILLGTVKGLFRYDPSSGRITVPYRELADELCIGLYRDSQDRMWLGTFNDGAFCIDAGGIRHYFYEGMPPVNVSIHDATPNLNTVFSFAEDAEGNLWICVYGGLGRFEPDSGRISLLRDSHPELGRFMFSRGISVAGDRIVLTSDNGWYIYDPATDSVTLGPAGLDYRIPSSNAIWDSEGLLWVGTSAGLYVITQDGQSHRISVRDGLPNDNILGLAADSLGNVWAATFKAVSRIKAVRTNEGYSLSVTTFGSNEGLDIGILFKDAIFTAGDGRIYLGGSMGFGIVDPASLYQRERNSAPVITGMKIFNRPIEVGEEYNGRCILKEDLSRISHIRLRHTETFLTFEFSNLNYINPNHTSYRYRLKNFDKDWTELHAVGAGSATYTLLRHGEYVFQVMAADNDTDWNRKCTEIAVTINPPFWQSVWAKVIYILLFCLAVAAVLWGLQLRMQRKAAARQEEERQRQKNEMDAMKFRFFTNVSHELRTPLSLIMLPLENIIRHTSSDSPQLSQLKTMHRHVSSLLDMVNQLLDFRKIEMHGETLNYRHGDIAEFMRSQVEAFQDAAHEKGLKLSFHNDMANPMMDFDADKIFKIVNNLLSNAMKFTPKGGRIVVRLSSRRSELMAIEVSDTGTGIAPEDLPHIFDRFYQSTRNHSPEGTGVGLNLVKQLAEMLGGNVSVESEVGAGSTFRVELPVRCEGDAQIAAAEDDSKDVTDSAPVPSVAMAGRTEEGVSAEASDGDHAFGEEKTQDRRTRLLVIEDNADFRNYITEELSEEFDVIKAVDGKDGLRKVDRHVIDIIICDVMMPRMDGFEFCRRIKTDINTSHIPVILLTAHSNNEVRSEGYRAGADAYISKPFSMEVLLARIHNLVEERRRRIKAFTSGSESVSSENMTATPLDRRLMDKVMECVMKNLGNASYTIDDLADDVAMQRMSLHRKLRTITGTTPAEFIRTIRLKEAARLLVSEPGLLVTEISERVGFNIPKYFTRHFGEMFGCTPSQYRRNSRGSQSDRDGGQPLSQ